LKESGLREVRRLAFASVFAASTAANADPANPKIKL
jgi:hypothetical protein